MSADMQAENMIVWILLQQSTHRHNMASAAGVYVIREDGVVPVFPRFIEHGNMTEGPIFPGSYSKVFCSLALPHGSQYNRPTFEGSIWNGFTVLGLLCLCSNFEALFHWQKTDDIYELLLLKRATIDPNAIEVLMCVWKLSFGLAFNSRSTDLSSLYSKWGIV